MIYGFCIAQDVFCVAWTGSVGIRAPSGCQRIGGAERQVLWRGVTRIERLHGDELDDGDLLG